MLPNGKREKNHLAEEPNGWQAKKMSEKQAWRRAGKRTFTSVGDGDGERVTGGLETTIKATLGQFTRAGKGTLRDRVLDSSGAVPDERT